MLYDYLNEYLNDYLNDNLNDFLNDYFNDYLKDYLNHYLNNYLYNHLNYYFNELAKHFYSCQEYVPGTPGGAWTREEMLAVRAKLWHLYTNENFVYKLANKLGKYGLEYPLRLSHDLGFFTAKVLRLRYSRSSSMHFEIIIKFIKLVFMIVSAMKMVKEDVMDVSTGREWVKDSPMLMSSNISSKLMI